MTEEEQKQDILKWIREFVEKPNALLNNWPPCPYAKEARLKNKVQIQISSLEDFRQTLQDQAHLLLESSNEVIVVALARGQLLEVKETQKIVRQFREQWVPLDVYILMDHPKDSEITGGLSMNQGTYQLFFLQKLSALKQASAELEKVGYYSHWEPEYYRRVVLGRREFESE